MIFSFLIFFKHIPTHTDLRYSFVVGTVLTFTTLLSPVFFYLWLSIMSGNANFPYGVTLAHAVGMSTLFVDFGVAYLRRKFDLETGLQEKEGYKVVMVQNQWKKKNENNENNEKNENNLYFGFFFFFFLSVQ